MRGVSGKQKAAEYADQFGDYLAKLSASGAQLPLRPDGSLNITQIARDSGIGDRGRLYTNERIRTALESAAKELSAQPPRAETAPSASNAVADNASTQKLERKLHRAEQQNAVLIAENAELRRKLKETLLQMGREDMMIETGRRVPPPFNG